jgi:hypothetical protein
VSPCPQEAPAQSGLFFSVRPVAGTSGALDALGKQPVAHFPHPSCSAGYLGRSRTDWIGYALVFWNRALSRRPLMTLASQTGPGPPHSPMAGFSFGRPFVPAARLSRLPTLGCLSLWTAEPKAAGEVISAPLSITRMIRNGEAYHATKAALARLRSRSTRSADYRNGYGCTARIEHLSLQNRATRVAGSTTYPVEINPPVHKPAGCVFKVPRRRRKPAPQWRP